MGWLLLFIVLVFLVLGFPMFLALVAAPLLVLMIYYPNMQEVFLVQQMIGGISSFVYIAIPMYIFAADIMCYGHSANRLIDFVRIFVRHIRGGMSIATAGGCMLFGAISGSSQATVVAIGRPMFAELLKGGYKEKDALALIISASGIAILIPPSTSMIMYGVVTGTSVGDLFIAGIGPGVLLFLLIAAYCCFAYGDVARLPRATMSEISEVVKRALPTLGFPILVMGGIYSGIFSPTEAAVAAVIFALGLEIFLYRTVGLRDLCSIAVSSGMVSAAVFIIIAGGNAFSWMISYARLPQEILSVLLGAEPTALYILIVTSIVFFLGALLVDPFVIIIILAPMFFPSALKAGIDPVHFGIVITMQVVLGGIFPPFGPNIFTACAVFNKPYLNVIRGVAPYLVIETIACVLVIFFPQISLFLLR